MSTIECELLKIETFDLKVHMNCQGCMHKVRKLLRKIEGVYKVDINAEEQKVTVTGSVNPSTLVQKLAKYGKHAEIWNAGDNHEQVNHCIDKNRSPAQYLTNDPNASEKQYMIPTFLGRKPGPEWCLNHDMGSRAVENEINQHLVTSLFNNGTDQNFTRINGNHKWEESMVPMMTPVSFQENSDTDYSGLGSEEWGWNLLVESLNEYGHKPCPMTNIHGYYHNHNPSKMMQLYYHNTQGN